MELKNQVTSLELSKKLKELNCKQESLFYWKYSLEIKYTPTLQQGEYCPMGFKSVSAFTVAELINMLQKYTTNDIIIYSHIKDVANFLAMEVIKYEESKI